MNSLFICADKSPFFAYVLRFPVLLPFRSFYCFPKLLIVLLCRRVSKRNPYTRPNTYTFSIHISSSLFLSDSSRRFSGPLIVCVRSLNLTKKILYNLVISNSFWFWHIRCRLPKYVSLKLLRNSRTTRTVNEWVSECRPSNYFLSFKLLYH